MYNPSFQQMKKQLLQLDKWLVMAASQAETKKFDPKNFLQLRLVVDQYAFARQVQAACDVAKLAASRLGGKEAPTHPDTEETLDQLRERIRSVVAYLDGFSAQDFA